MTRDALIEKLKELATAVNFDPAKDHVTADQLLLDYINDPLITKLFDEIEKWYA